MSKQHLISLRSVLVLCLLLVGIGASSQENTGDSEVTVTVTARRWEEPLQDVPGSISVISGQTLATAGVQTVTGAAHLVPDLTLPEFSARWLSFPFVRGIGSGRNTPAVSTIIDGVPQLSYITANQELLDVDRIEFLRGPQGSLYGRNALAGVINVAPSLPSNEPSVTLRASTGSDDLTDMRGGIEGPLGSTFRGSLHGGYSARDGFTTNDITGHRLDNRQAAFGFTQLLLPAHDWTYRFSLTGENDRDGDYGLGDLASLRARPHHIAHDYEGFNRRELAQPVFTAIHRGSSYDVTSITALQTSHVRDSTDADFSPFDLLRRGTDEDFQAWTQEIRIASPADADLLLSKRASLRWLLGALLFTSRDTADYATEYRPAAVDVLGVPLPFTQHDTATLHDTGIGAYGQARLTLDRRLDLTLGLRHDFEHKTAALRGFTDPQLAPPSSIDARRDFNRTSPQATLAYHLAPSVLWYAGMSQGYKTGGFNAQAPPEKVAFNAETSRTMETGVKASWQNNRVVANLSLFRTKWDDIQLDVPTGVPGVFFIDNAGKATSQGAEAEVIVRPLSGLELSGGLGLLDAEFGAGSQSAGSDISGHALPFAPHLTGRLSALYQKTLTGGCRGFARADLLHTGRYVYDASNRAAQQGFMTVSIHLGATKGDWHLDGWVNNLFNADYIPVAFPVALAPSGYVGESGAPRTMGFNLGYAF